MWIRLSQLVPTPYALEEFIHLAPLYLNALGGDNGRGPPGSSHLSGVTSAIKVAFVESEVTRSVASGPKLLSFDPLFDDIPNLRKPFTTALRLTFGLMIMKLV